MGFLLSAIKGIHTASKVAKTAIKTGLKVKNLAKVFRDMVITYVTFCFCFIVLIGAAIYSVTGAVGEMFNFLLGKGDEEGKSIVEVIDSMTDAELETLSSEMGGEFNPRKIKLYLEQEIKSVPTNVDGTKTITLNGQVGESTVQIDTSEYVDKYKTKWEFIASVDLATFRAGDVNDRTVIDGALTIHPEFSWNKTYSRDTTDYWKTWTEVKEYDPTTGSTTRTKDTSGSAKENVNEVKDPLAIPDTVKTMFGDYIYNVQTDKTIKDENWCSPFVISEKVTTRQDKDKLVDDTSKPIYQDEQVYIVKGMDNNEEYFARIKPNTTFVPDTSRPYEYIGTDKDYYIYESGTIWSKKKLLLHKDDIPADEVNQFMVFVKDGTEKVFTGRYEQKQTYKTITITEQEMKITKQKIIEDVVSSINQSFNPTKFIKYINDAGLSVKDLDLVKETLINVPSGTELVKEIDKVIDGNYGDVGTPGSGGTPGGGGNVVTGINGVYPLYIQWDPESTWWNIPYSASNVAKAGCGATTMAMAMAGLGADISSVSSYDIDKNGLLDPGEVARYSTANGHVVVGVGTADSLYSGLGAATGLQSKVTYNWNEAFEALKLGKPVIASFGPGTFTSAGHIMLLTGVTNDGKISLNDPNNVDKSKQTWDAELIKRESVRYIIMDNPNYKIEQFYATSYYAYGDALQGGWGTATGNPEGGLHNKDLSDKLIAVDKTLIPLSFKNNRKFVYISFPEEHKKKVLPGGEEVLTDGYYEPVDVGGAIKGHHIDVYSGDSNVFGPNVIRDWVYTQWGNPTVSIRYDPRK